MSYRIIVLLMIGSALLLAAGYYYGTQGSSTTNEVSILHLQPSGQSDVVESEAHSDRLAGKAGRSVISDARDRQTHAADPYTEALSIFDVGRELLADGELDEPELAAMMMNWIEPCQRAVQGVKFTEVRQFAVGLSEQAAEALNEFCGELTSDSEADIYAYRDAWSEVAVEAINPFMGTANSEGIDAGLRAAVEAIFRSRSEVEIFNALAIIVQFGELESPFEGVEQASAAYLFSWRIKQDAALALLCNNLGGCSGHHPLVARHCLAIEWHDGCYRPIDIYHAIEQTQNPIQQEVFWSLINQVFRMRRTL